MYVQFLTYPIAAYHSISQSTVVCTNGDLRLAGSSVLGQGRVEICINETWGTICDDSWGTPDATVACQALGFSRFG